MNVPAQGAESGLDVVRKIANNTEVDWFRLERLEEMGHELRRPEAENLGAGIYELRAKHQGVNYRMLYFFHGKTAVVVTHGFSKQRAAVPSGELRLAQKRKLAFEANPAKHSFKRGT